MNPDTSLKIPYATLTDFIEMAKSGFKTQPAMGEMIKAWKRVFKRDGRFLGVRPFTRDLDIMGWVLDFAKRDLTSLGRDGWRELSFELKVFFTHPTALTPHLAPLNPLGPPFPQKVILGLQKRAIASLKWITGNEDGRAIYVKLWKTDRIAYFDQELGRWWASETIQVDDYNTLFDARMIALLPSCGDRIRRCPGCDQGGVKALFVAARADKRFHSTQCFSKYKMREKRGTPPERYNRPGRPRLNKTRKPFRKEKP